MAKQPGRRPDYTLSVLNKRTNAKGIIGAGWKQEGGRISIAFNPCVVIDTRLDADLVISLFPAQVGQRQTPDAPVDDGDASETPPKDPIPF